MGNEAGAAAAEGTEPQDPTADDKPQNTGEGEGTEPQDPKPAEGKNTPNVHKLERDVANRDKRIAELDPTFSADPRRGILLSFCVQGCFYAFANNSGRMDETKLVALLAEIAKAAQISANEVLVGLGWLFKEGKVAGQEDNKVVLA